MRLLTALVLGAGVQQALAQEPTRVLTVGDRVRIEYRTPAGVARRTGALERISIDSVALRPTPRDALSRSHVAISLPRKLALAPSRESRVPSYLGRWVSSWGRWFAKQQPRPNGEMRKCA